LLWFLLLALALAAGVGYLTNPGKESLDAYARSDLGYGVADSGGAEKDVEVSGNLVETQNRNRLFFSTGTIVFTKTRIHVFGIFGTWHLRGKRWLPFIVLSITDSGRRTRG
jgi:hypothetical protein